MIMVRLGCTKSVGGIHSRGRFAILPQSPCHAQGGGFHGLAHCMECVPLQRHSGKMTEQFPPGIEEYKILQDTRS